MKLTENIKSEKYKADLTFIKNPITFSSLPNAEMGEPPLLAENNEEVLREICGYSGD